MENYTKIRILNKFKPFHRILKAYNCNNFHFHNWRSIFRSIFHAFCVAIIFMILPIWIVLIVWHLIENSDDFKVIVAGLPIVITIAQADLAFIALIVENGTIVEIMNRIQEVIDRRKSNIFIDIIYILSSSVAYTRILRICFHIGHEQEVPNQSNLIASTLVSNKNMLK